MHPSTLVAMLCMVEFPITIFLIKRKAIPQRSYLTTLIISFMLFMFGSFVLLKELQSWLI